MAGTTVCRRYNLKKSGHFSRYVPQTSGKLRRERIVHAESREEAIHPWQAFHAEISGVPPALEPPQTLWLAMKAE